MMLVMLHTRRPLVRHRRERTSRDPSEEEQSLTSPCRPGHGRRRQRPQCHLGRGA